MNPYAWVCFTTRLDGLKERKVIYADTYKTSSGDLSYVLQGKDMLALYTAPSQQPLTDEQIESIWDSTLSEDVGITALRKIARVIEAKLREKNT